MLTDSIKKIVSVALVSVFLLMPLAGCSEETENKIPANYGSYGADFARQLATTYPYRKPFSSQETAAGEMIRLELSNLGYDVVTQPFSTDEGSSNNYIVTIEGKGFMGETEEGSGEYTDVRRSVVIGAHYDSAYGSDDIPEDYTYDGISDNASGVGCLMTIAKRISEYENIGFDVTIVFFGAGNADHAGARAYYASLTQEEKESMEVMYCVESIYGGDKVYASAGFNSLELSQKYAMRRKLYQAYDVAYDSELASRNGFSLLYNECGIQTDLDEDGDKDVYREVSLHKSDYVVFDEANIPIVYFDSCDYFFTSIDDMKETKNLHLQEFGGAIRNTFLDSTEVLDPILVTEEKDILEIRINNIAYVILESMLKGSDFAMTHEEYEYMLANPTESLEEEIDATAATTTALAPVVNTEETELDEDTGDEGEGEDGGGDEEDDEDSEDSEESEE
ncbi:alkaline phosphatase isozyme conversion protein [Ruminococcaceae bacterium KH2T8]|nr:alkaline phosphatase isozyme conversion protein [Ruminococcaceae bacterium KH2T8]